MATVSYLRKAPQAKSSDTEDLPNRHSGLLTFFFALIFVYPVMGTVLPGTINSVTFILGSGLTVLYLLNGGGGKKSHLQGVWLLWLGLALVTLTGYFTAVLPPTLSVLQMLLYVGTIALAAFLSTTSGWSENALRALLLLLSVHLAATFLFFLLPDLYTSSVAPRFFPESTVTLDYRDALTPNRSQNAVLLALGFLISLTETLVRNGANKSSTMLRVLTGSFYLGVVLAGVRGPLIYATLTAVVLLVIFRGKSSVKMVFPALAVLGALVAFSFREASDGKGAISRLLNTFKQTDLDDAASGRLQLWEKAFHGWQENPWFGKGWRTFEYTYASGTTREIAHNQILGSLYETGVVGTFLYLSAALISLAITLKALRTGLRIGAPPSVLTAVGASLALQGFYLLYANTTGQLFSKPYTYTLYFIAIAMGLSVVSYLRSDRTSSS